jgi:hypothetical protein
MCTGAYVVLQALQYLDRDAQGQLHEHHKKWKEYWCVKNQRLYYVNNAAGGQLRNGMSASSPERPISLRMTCGVGQCVPPSQWPVQHPAWWYW